MRIRAAAQSRVDLHAVPPDMSHGATLHAPLSRLIYFSRDERNHARVSPTRDHTKMNKAPFLQDGHSSDTALSFCSLWWCTLEPAVSSSSTTWFSSGESPSISWNGTSRWNSGTHETLSAALRQGQTGQHSRHRRRARAGRSPGGPTCRGSGWRRGRTSGWRGPRRRGPGSGSPATSWWPGSRNGRTPWSLGNAVQWEKTVGKINK